VESIKDIAAEKQLYSDGTIPNTIPYVTLADNVYSATKGFMADGTYVYTYNIPEPETSKISASSVGHLEIGINVTNNADTIQQQLKTFANGVCYNTWEDLKQAFVNKGWTVTWTYGGNFSSITYDMGGDRVIPCPIYAQLIEEEDKERAEYCSEDGTKFYNIKWGHDVTNYDDFQQFDSLEDAAVAYGVIRKEFLELDNQPTLF
jgi:hypothetical protein